MSRLDAAASTPLSARWTRDWLPAAAVVVGIVGAVAVALLTGSKFGQVVVVGAAALALGVLALRSPVFAILLLVVTMFLFKPLKQQIHLPIPLFLAVFAVLIVSTALWIERTPGRLRGIGQLSQPGTVVPDRRRTDIRHRRWPVEARRREFGAELRRPKCV